MKIQTIFTGGTIGSHIASSGIIETSRDAKFQLLELYNKHYPNTIQFQTLEAYYILSENLSSLQLLTLIDIINRVLTDNSSENHLSDGIIITHGTDTLQYTAAILSYLFGDVSIPILLVSSDYVLTDKRANGITNFHYAVRFIEEKRGNGVFVSYCNKGGLPTIHRGNRLQNPLPFSADVSSIADSWYGRFEKEEYVINPNNIAFWASEPIPSLKRLPVNLNTIRLTEYPPIQKICPYVGMNYTDIPVGTKAILHESFHSGTIRVDGNLKEYAALATKCNIPIFVTGLTLRDAHYETVNQYRQFGIIPLYDRAPIAQYCKLWIAIDNNLDIMSMMQTPVADDAVVTVLR